MSKRYFPPPPLDALAIGRVHVRSVLKNLFTVNNLVTNVYLVLKSIKLSQETQINSENTSRCVKQNINNIEKVRWKCCDYRAVTLRA